MLISILQENDGNQQSELWESGSSYKITMNSDSQDKHLKNKNNKSNLSFIKRKDEHCEKESSQNTQRNQRNKQETNEKEKDQSRNAVSVITGRTKQRLGQLL